MINAISTSAQATARPPRFQNPFYLDRSFIKSLAYYDYTYVYRSLSVGDPLTLKREPNNQYDEFAVGVHFCGRKLGYWPSPENKAIANMLDREIPVKGKIISIHPNREEVYEALSVEAFVKI